jgi:hypothetical protein
MTRTRADKTRPHPTTKGRTTKEAKDAKKKTPKEFSHRWTQINTDDFRALSFVFFESFVVPSSSLLTDWSAEKKIKTSLRTNIRRFSQIHLAAATICENLCNLWTNYPRRAIRGFSFV